MIIVFTFVMFAVPSLHTRLIPPYGSLRTGHLNKIKERISNLSSHHFLQRMGCWLAGWTVRLSFIPFMVASSLREAKLASYPFYQGCTVRLSNDGECRLYRMLWRAE